MTPLRLYLKVYLMLADKVEFLYRSLHMCGFWTPKSHTCHHPGQDSEDLHPCFNCENLLSDPTELGLVVPTFTEVLPLMLNNETHRKGIKME